MVLFRTQICFLHLKVRGDDRDSGIAFSIVKDETNQGNKILRHLGRSSVHVISSVAV